MTILQDYSDKDVPELNVFYVFRQKYSDFKVLMFFNLAVAIMDPTRRWRGPSAVFSMG